MIINQAENQALLHDQRLAVEGGRPVRSVALPLSRPWITDEEIAAVSDAIRAGWLIGNGPVGKRVEELLSTVLDGQQALFVSSCTAALEMAVGLTGVGPGDEVICPSFTFVSCANAIVRAGARPIFVDIDPETLNIDPDAVEAAITDQARAMIIVHYGGRACDMDRLMRIAANRRIAVIEDAAHALGARYDGRPLGTIGDFGCFSFHGTKDVVCGEGGALVCRAADMDRRAEVFREKGTNRAAFLRGEVDRYTWISEGSSFVASDVLAAILSVQLQRLDTIVQRKRELARRLTEALGELASFVSLPREWGRIRSSWHVYPLLVPQELRDRAIRALLAEGIGATFHYVPLHLSPFAQERYGYIAGDLPYTERISASLIRLPLFAAMSDQDLDDVANATLKVFRRLSADRT